MYCTLRYEGIEWNGMLKCLWHLCWLLLTTRITLLDLLMIYKKQNIPNHQIYDYLPNLGQTRSQWSMTDVHCTIAKKPSMDRYPKSRCGVTIARNWAQPMSVILHLFLVKIMPEIRHLVVTVICHVFFPIHQDDNL